MASSTITISNDYGYVLLAAISTSLMNLAHAFQTGSYRKAAGVSYPNAYATPEQAATNPAAYLLNCAQRAHANFTENHTSTVAALLIAGLKYPRTAAACGFGWTVSRYLYMLGYCDASKPAGKGRYRGIAYWLFQVVLMGFSAAVGVQLVLGSF